jgi:hypothetical protein
VWLRNFVFILLCLAGLTGLASSLVPVHKKPRDSRLHALNTASVADREVIETAARIDQALRADWAREKLVPTPRADDLTIARRLSLALMGTIPSLEELRRLEAEPADGRLDRWLTSLLEDRRCHDYLAERLARAFVGVQDGPFIVYRRRRFLAWLGEKLQANRPYDEIVRDLITESGLWTDHPATNFITVTVKPDQEKGPDEGELAARVSRAFLGVRLDCAECHDHPFQPWKQADFQGLAAFFGHTKQRLTGVTDGEGDYVVENRLTGEKETIAPCVPFQSELLPAAGTRREQLAAWVTHHDNRAFARAAANRFWAELFGRPLVEPIDDIPSAGEPPPVLDILADDFVAHGCDLRHLIRAIVLTEAFRLDSRREAGSPDEITPEHEAAWAAFPITRMRPEQVIGGILQSGSLTTIDYESHIVVRILRVTGQNDFIKRYGDLGEEEFSPQGGTIPQRLLMMNGKQLQDRIAQGPLTNATSQIAALAPTDAKAVETAYLAVLTRRPTAEERRYFEAALASTTDGRSRNERLEDIYWGLLNSTEFSWNH